MGRSLCWVWECGDVGRGGGEGELLYEEAVDDVEEEDGGRRASSL